MQKKIIGISLGDPAGIGPEILIKAFPEITKLKKHLPLVVGDTSVIVRNLKYAGLKYRLKSVKVMGDIDENALNIYETSVLSDEKFPIGKDSAVCGNASFTYVQKAVDLWKQKMISALVTLPISKKAWHLAGKFYSGHTEFLASELNAKKYAMIMEAGTIRVLLVTTHIPFKEVPVILTRDLIVDKVMTVYKFLLGIGIKTPVIVVSSLNPHGGEGGLLGTEEEKVIKPAISLLNKRSIRCTGPFPADAVFKKALEEKTDLIVAMYHDQALIPLKTFFHSRLVNYTAGLEMIRTSPGHGTGFDIAYSNKADPSSFIQSYKKAAYLVKMKSLSG